MLTIQDLSFAYPGQPALFRHWSATVGAGVTLLHGDTGSGKSTLLRVLAGALPAEGQLTLLGASLHGDREAYRRQLFFLEPATDAFDGLTARECAAELTAGDPRFNEAEWQRLVEGFALMPHLAKPLYMLSTGSKRKVWLATALASGRPLVLLDEPTGGLDGPSIRCLRDGLARIAERADRAVVLASGEAFDHLPLAGSIELPLSGA